MKNINAMVTSLLLAALVTAGPAVAQDAQNQSATQPNKQVTLQLQDNTEDTRGRPARVAPVLPQVKELEPRPHGRSRTEPAPAPRPLIEVKRL